MSETAQQLPAERPPQPSKTALVASGGKVTAIIPHSIEEMFRLAEAIHRSGLVPASLNTREKVMVAMMAGAELGMPPWQSVQSFAVIGNRPAIWGDAIPALLWSNGFKIREWFEGTPYEDSYTAHCIITRPDGTEIPAEFSVADAKEGQLWTKSGPWQTSKKRMLKMRARAFGARDGAPDVLRGMQIREEVEDYVMGQPALPREGGGLRERLQSHAHQAETSGGFSQAHVASELSDHETEVVNAEFSEAVDPGDGDLDIACDRCGAQPGEPCKPDCDGADGDPEDQEPGDLSGAAPDPATTVGHAAEPSAEAGAATAASRPGSERPQSQGSTATGSSESASAPTQTSTSGGSTATSSTASPSETATTDVGGPPAVFWANQIEPTIDAFDSVAAIDAFCADPDNGRYFQELEAADAGRAKRLNAKIRGKRKALQDRERT